jgi:hypothetical protein
LRYLPGTRGLGVLFRKSSFLLLSVFSDVDWANNSDNRRSTSGFAKNLDQIYLRGVLVNKPQYLDHALRLNTRRSLIL